MTTDGLEALRKALKREEISLGPAVRIKWRTGVRFARPTDIVLPRWVVVAAFIGLVVAMVMRAACA